MLWELRGRSDYSVAGRKIRRYLMEEVILELGLEGWVGF